MAKNYFIGIGGTGARVAEALVHLCAAGYGPEELSVFLIDPDEGNGNLSRTKTALTSYQRARRRFAEPRDGVKLFATDVATPDPPVWSIFKRRDVRLADHINYQNLKSTQRDLADFVRVLFSEEELDERLDEGFRGHPSIGAVVMSDPDEQADPWKTFWSDVENSSQPNEVRVFLVGSIFGGTGAAGIPTFGAKEMIKFHQKAALSGEKSKVLLGAALALPYFTFEAEGHDRLFVTAADFPIATKAALQFYDDKKLAFDQLYFIGDSLGQKVGEFSPGSRTQENRPHYIELTTALAACDFFEQAPVESVPEKQYFTAGRTGETVAWDGLPVSRDADEVQARQDQLKRCLVTMTAFSYALLDYGLPLLETPAKEIDDPWHRDHFYVKSFFRQDTSKDPRQPESKAALEAVGQYAMQFLAWITALDNESVDLVDRRKLVAHENGALHLLAHQQHPHSIGAFLKERSEDKKFNAFLNELNELKIESGSMTPSDKYVNLFYEAASRFSEGNYRITQAKAD